MFNQCFRANATRQWCLIPKKGSGISFHSFSVENDSKGYSLPIIFQLIWLYSLTHRIPRSLTRQQGCCIPKWNSLSQHAVCHSSEQNLWHLSYEDEGSIESCASTFLNDLWYLVGQVPTWFIHLFHSPFRRLDVSTSQVQSEDWTVRCLSHRRGNPTANSKRDYWI